MTKPVHADGGRRIHHLNKHKQRVKAAWQAKEKRLEKLLDKIEELDSHFAEDRSKEGYGLVVYDLELVWVEPTRFQIATRVTNRNLKLAEQDLKRAEAEHKRRTWAKANPEEYASILQYLNLQSQLLSKKDTARIDSAIAFI